ncbi:nucleoside diphosphate kinase 7 isoform X2 [Hyalella azteca]|uniref:Nucleoside diphosphate kinase 7 isoform X2 n=1 Tax=Hyalella azteca TaxID=294128 RepID=A0A8B7NB71_HYAAZ|nr:nucleoside diphosphate kinase 7 isoform X2 [Hyalella azteca]
MSLKPTVNDLTAPPKDQDSSCQDADSLPEWRFLVSRVPFTDGDDQPALQLVFNVGNSMAKVVQSDSQVVVSAKEAVGALDVYEGATLTFTDQTYTVGAAADTRTAAAVACYRQSTFVMIKPDAMQRAGEVISRIEEIATLRIADMRLVALQPSMARLFYAEHSQRTFFEDLVSYVTSGPILAMRLVGPDAIKVWREALGPTDSNEARRSAPGSVRALFGTDKQRNAAHGSDSREAAGRELAFFFKDTVDGICSTSEPLTELSCLVLPHVLKDRALGSLWRSLHQHHDCTPARAELVRLNYIDAWRYATATLLPRTPPTPQQMDEMQSLLSGPAVSLHLKSSRPEETRSEFLHRFKDIIGPRNPAKARKAAVESIRANFGQTNTTSGVLCPWYDWLI